MHFRITGLLAVLMCLIGTLSAQTDFRPGYIITNELDTLTGYIDYRGDLRSSRICMFKDDRKSDPTEYDPTEIYGYHFDQGKFIISKEVLTNEGKDVRFLEFLVNGEASLYYFRDEEGDHYLIEKEIGTLEELADEKVEVSRDEGDFSFHYKKYIGQLKATFSDCEEIQPEVEKSTLSHSSLIRLTSQYHDYVCDGEKCIIYQKVLPDFRVIVAPVAGMSFSNIRFHSDEVLAPTAFEPSISPRLGVVLQFSAPRLNEKISILTEALISKDYFFGYRKEVLPFEVKYYDIHLNTTYWDQSLILRYTYPKGRFRPTLSLGGQMSFLLWSSSKYIQERVKDQIVLTYLDRDLPLGNAMMGLVAELGVDIRLTPKTTIFLNVRAQSGTALNNVLPTNVKSISVLSGIYF